MADIGPAAKPAVPALVALLGDKDRELRREALIALAQIGPDAASASPALLAELKNEKSEVRAGAIYALVKIGNKDVIPALMQAAEDKNDKHLRDVAAWGLVTLDPSNPQYVKTALPVLINNLTNEMELARRESIAALGTLGDAARIAVVDLVKIAETDKNPAIRNEALGAQLSQGLGTEGVESDTDSTDEELRETPNTSSLCLSAAPAVT